MNLFPKTSINGNIVTQILYLKKNVFFLILILIIIDEDWWKYIRKFTRPTWPCIISHQIRGTFRTTTRSDWKRNCCPPTWPPFRIAKTKSMHSLISSGHVVAVNCICWRRTMRRRRKPGDTRQGAYI